MISIELSHPELTEYKHFANGVLISEGVCNKSVTFQVTPGSDKISLWFFPWKIKPLVRVNNILVNYSLADICIYDHMLEMIIKKDFFDQYHKKDVERRIISVFGNGPVDPMLYDLLIGIGVSHKTLINKIRDILEIE